MRPTKAAQASKTAVNTVKATNRLSKAVTPPAAPIAAPQPTESEISEYAKWLGLVDPDLFWIAKHALSTPLPAPWLQCVTDEGDVFFHNSKTKESVWDHPCDSFYKNAVIKFSNNEISKDDLTKLIQDSVPIPAASTVASGKVGSRVASTLAVNVDTPVKARQSPKKPATIEPVVSAALQVSSAVPSESAESLSQSGFEEDDIPTTTIKVSGSGLSHAAIQSDRVPLEHLRQELQETKQRLTAVSGELRQERVRSKELEVQLASARMVALPATTELPALKTEVGRLGEEVGVLRQRLEDANKTAEIWQSRANVGEEKKALMKAEMGRRKEVVLKTLNSLIDEDRMTRLKFAGLEEANGVLREEVVRLRRMLQEVVMRQGRGTGGGFFSNLCGGQSRELGSVGEVGTFQMPPQPQQFNSRVGDLLAELRAAVAASPVASPLTGEGQDDSLAGLDLGGTASDIDSVRVSVTAGGTKGGAAVFNARSNNKFAPPRRR